MWAGEEATCGEKYTWVLYIQMKPYNLVPGSSAPALFSLYTPAVLTYVLCYTFTCTEVKTNQHLKGSG